MSKRRDYSDPVYKRFRSAVLKRDNFTCQMCNIKGKRVRLNVHHIMKWSSASTLRYDVDNGITLCNKCHKEVTGKDAVIAKSEATWKEGVKDRRTIGGPGSGGGGRSGTFPKYGNYSIYGNMVILCEGQIEIALEVCWKLINTLDLLSDEQINWDNVGSWDTA